MKNLAVKIQKKQRGMENEGEIRRLYTRVFIIKIKMMKIFQYIVLQIQKDFVKIILEKR